MNLNSLHNERYPSRALLPKVCCKASPSRYCPASTDKVSSVRNDRPAFAGFYAVILGAGAVMTPSRYP